MKVLDPAPGGEQEPLIELLGAIYLPAMRQALEELKALGLAGFHYRVWRLTTEGEAFALADRARD